MHHRGSSPVLDGPEFSSFRRLKPLPKRRRTADAAAVPRSDDLASPVTGLFDGIGLIAEELIAQRDSISSQMALQSYYTSILGNDNCTRGSGDAAQNENSVGPLPQTLNWSAVYQRFMGGRLSSAKQEEAHGVGDYVDHLQQPGNTKKRKVPANMSGCAGGGEVSLPLIAEEITDGHLPARRHDHELDISVASLSSAAPVPRKGRISPSTLAGLQHKELLNDRKRQLAAVLGALSLSDTLALDQVLSTHIPFISTMPSPTSDPQKVRLSRKRGPRLARAAQFVALQNLGKNASLPAVPFTFCYPSATSDRLSAAKEEMLALRSRFEAELARQAAKAAAEAKQAAIVANGASRPKRSELDQQPTCGGVAGNAQSAELPYSPSSRKSRGNKKTNVAADPHCRKNYVPSRLTGSARANQAYASQGPQGALGNRSLRFLSANIPPRKRQSDFATPTSQITDPAEEWICPRCEFSLFYSDGPEHKRAIRNRKQVLRRRRRAQERAAGGLSVPKTPAKLASDEDYDHFDHSPTQSPTISKSYEWKEGPDIKGMKGQDHLQSG